MRPFQKRPILKIASLLALPIEIVNFWVVGYPAASDGLSSSSQSSALAAEWYLIHAPGVVASNDSTFLRSHAAANSAMFWIVGYVDTALLFAAILWTTGFAIRRLRKLSSR
ncbi:hypothetical protein P8935_05695 [Telmatobacter sp. DSM 110680]|uniref:PepSY-associated TM region n=1 Tax=Telmatobacter sp. DSM 110680 TaxID=3036704 RepID=A0AAU7DMC1_9BACT